MSGKRLLDAARIYGAAKSVAKTHIALRSRQFDVFSQTSTVAKAVKSQTDRVTVTASAAYTLAKRLSEDAPVYASAASANGYSSGQQSTAYSGASQSSQERVPAESEPQTARTSEKVETADRSRDTVQPGASFNTRTSDGAPTSSVVDHGLEAEINVTQKKADRHALPDGTIPSAGLPVDGDARAGGQDTFADRSQAEPEKDPLEQQQPHKSAFEPTESDQSTIPDPSFAARKEQQLSEIQIPSAAASGEPTHTTPDTFVDRSESHSPSLSSLPRAKLPKHTEGSEGSDLVKDQALNQDVYYSPRPTTKRDSITDEEVPEGVDLNVFHSPGMKSAMSGGRDDRRKVYEAKLNAARQKAREEAQQPRTQQPPSASTSTPSKPSSPAKEAADTEDLAATLAAEAQTQQQEEAIANSPNPPHALHESRVPSSRLGRIWQFGSLASGMAFGAARESLRRVTGSEPSGSLMLSEANMNRLVAKLSRMRGAALKLGQMMSFQDSKLLPPAINAVLQRVQDGADYMPPSQRDGVLATNLGADWRKLFSKFEDVPIAAASIGQVHRATLAENGEEVAVKVQYPGVKDSISSDLSNISLLLTASRLLPPGLYLDKTIANARTELAWECDYVREADCGRRFSQLLEGDERFDVPTVYDAACGPEVLTASFMHGKAVTKLPNLTQDEADEIGTRIMGLCLRELCEWRFMQTDPNWTNFLYNRQTKKIELLDFGASREYPSKFVDPYVELLVAASKGDREVCREKSVELGYLTGREGKTMLDAHVESIMTLAEPFSVTADLKEGRYDFRDQTITDRVRAKIGIMVRERLAPPPEETYSLHRKLSGAFLLCSRLGSRVPTRQLFEDAVETWRQTKGQESIA